MPALLRGAIALTVVEVGADQVASEVCLGKRQNSAHTGRGARELAQLCGSSRVHEHARIGSSMMFVLSA